MLTKEIIDQIDEILKPRTPNEKAIALAFGMTPGLTEEMIRAQKPTWRTKTSTYRGCEFCDECDQLIPESYCKGCGLGLPATMPSPLDIIATPSAARSELETVAKSMLRACSLQPKTLLRVLHALNATYRIPFDSTDINMIFGEAAAAEVVRRRGGKNAA